MKALSILLLAIFVFAGCASTDKQQMSEDDRWLWEDGGAGTPAAPAK